MGGFTDLQIHGLSHGRELGSGGFATVYAATEERFGRTVAVKIMTNLDETGRRRFEREQLTMGRMAGHPNVVVPHSSGYTDIGCPYLVMEFLERGSLADLVEAEGPLSWQRASTYLVPIADALGYGHQLGIMHRDVKPENILVGSNGIAKLADFGIASIRESTSTMGRAFSLAHAPPETFDGGDDRRDERSDLYSLASTLFTLVSGHPPFHTTSPTDSDLAYLTRIVEAEVPDVGNSPDQNAFMARAMAKNPDDRFQSAADLKLALGRTCSPAGETVADFHRSAPAPVLPHSRPPIGGGQAVAAERGSAGSGRVGRDRSPRVLVSLVATGVVVAAAVVGGWYLFQDDTPDASSTETSVAEALSIVADGDASAEESETVSTDRAVADAQAAIERGLIAFDNDDFEGAIQHFDEAVALDPSSSDAFVHRGRAYKELREFGRSWDDHDRAIELDPGNALAWHGRGAANNEFGEYQKAISDLDRAIELDPTYADSYVSRGLAHGRLGMTERELDDYNQALEVEPDNVGALNNRASVFSARGESDRALEDYDRAIELDPSNPVPLLNRGHEHATRGDYRAAVDDLDRAIELDPKNAVAFTNRGVAYDGLGETELANDDYREAVRLTETGEATYPMEDLSELNARLGDS